MLAASAVWRELQQMVSASKESTENFLAIDDFLMSAVDGPEDPDVSSVVAGVLSEVPQLRHKATIGLLSGRVVFSATDLAGNEFVVKTIARSSQHERARAALFNEAMVLSHLRGVRSPALVRVAATKSGSPFIVRRMLPGRSLDRQIFHAARTSQAPTFADVRALLAGVSEAVAEMHGLNVVHGDLKPANILAEWHPRGSESSVKPLRPISILDFESASIVGRSAELGLQGVSRGTPYFMAPERYASTRVSRASDVYSLTALASLLLTGRPVRPGSAAGQRVPSTRLREALRRGLAVDLTTRQQSVEQWFDDIDAGLAEVIASDGELAAVNWPLDSNAVMTEVAHESLTVSMAVVRGRFNRVAEQVDLATFDSVLGESLTSTDDATKQLVEALWYDQIPLAETAQALRMEVDTAKSRLTDFVEALEQRVRQLAIDRASESGSA